MVTSSLAIFINKHFTFCFFLVTINLLQFNLSGGVPERLIGAVLKTVERSRVPWVRIPPPPPFKSREGLFCWVNRELAVF